MTVVSSCPVKMEIPKVEMGDNTGTGEELWEGLGVENEGKNKKTRKDLVGDCFLSIVIY